MFLLNLSLGEFLALFGAMSSIVVVLYLLDRRKRRVTVATLRFWTPAANQAAMKHRRRIQQPWSLLLQILSIALLLLALAQLRWGSPNRSSRDHVLILDTSAWMAARGKNIRLIDEAKTAARAYVRSLPSSDRVMVVRADALATPATGFEASRPDVERAIAQSVPGATALNLDQALQFARHVQQVSAARAGEIVYVGAGRIPEHDPASSQSVPNLRVLPVSEPVENCGLRKIGLRRSATDNDLWEIFVSVRNYGSTPHAVILTLSFGGAPVGSRRLDLKANSEQSATFEHRTRAAGWLEARLSPHDAFPADDRAVLEVPSQQAIRVTVYSTEPDLLRPVLNANPRVQAVFRPPSEYKPDPADGIVILDRFHPPQPPAGDAVWIEPPGPGSPIPVRATVQQTSLARWRSDHPLGTGLRSKDVKLDSTLVFEAAPTDIPVAEVESGPVILARPSRPKIVALGFHPVRSALRYELATPLLFANILRWMSPEIFRRWELNGGSVGSIAATLDKELDPGSVRVLFDNGKPLPFTVQGRVLRFFSGTPGTVRILAGDRELVYSLTLPEVAEATWEPPAGARRGIPRSGPAEAASRDLWQILALLGGLGLMAEWLLFGRYRGVLRGGSIPKVIPFLPRAARSRQSTARRAAP